RDRRRGLASLRGRERRDRSSLRRRPVLGAPPRRVGRRRRSRCDRRRRVRLPRGVGREPVRLLRAAVHARRPLRASGRRVAPLLRRRAARRTSRSRAVVRARQQPGADSVVRRAGALLSGGRPLLPRFPGVPARAARRAPHLPARVQQVDPRAGGREARPAGPLRAAAATVRARPVRESCPRGEGKGAARPRRRVRRSLKAMAADPIEVLRRAHGGSLPLDFAEALTPPELEDLASQLKAPLPRELTAVLAETRAIDGIEPIDFTGRTMDVEVGELSPAGLPIAAVGAGNFWVLDLAAEDSETAPVFFLCHDPPVFAFQSPTLGDFLDELFRKHEPPHQSLVRDVQENHVHEIWRTNPGVIGRDAALGSDVELSEFAASLDEEFDIVDLRTLEVGMGFAWGRYGARTELRRDGYARLFAYGRTE